MSFKTYFSTSGGLSLATADARYVNVAGDTMTGNLSISTLTSGRIAIIGTGGLITDDAHFTFDPATDRLHVHAISGDATDGLLIESDNGTDIGILGAANTANVTWYGSHNFNAATANTIASFGASKTLTSLSTVTYPSLTELSYLKGVTSSVQTQLDGKVDVAGDTMTGALTTYNGVDALKSGSYPFYTKSYNIGTYTEPTLNDYGTMQFYYKMNDGEGAAISTGTAGLVSMWKLDEGTGTSATDSVGSNTGTITGASWNGYGQCQYTGDNSLSFTSTNNINLGDFTVCEGLTTATMMGWAFKTDVTAGGTLFRKIGSSTSSYGAYFANVSGMKFVVEVRNGAASYATWDFAGVIRNGEWFHWAVCYDGAGATNADKLKLYVNGVQRTLTFTLAVGSTTPANTANMYIGYDSSTGTWGGALDQISFFNTNEAANIATYYATESGSTLVDETANANVGYLGRASTSGVPPVWTTDPSSVADQALDFTTGKVCPSTAWRPTSSFTICTVMKFNNLFTGTAGKYPQLFSNWYYGSGSDQNGFSCRYNYSGDNNLSFYITNGTSTAVTASVSHTTAGLNTSDWFHIVFRFDDAANTITIWVNGVQKATASFTTTVGYQGTEIFTIGSLNFPYSLASAANYEADAKFAWVAAYSEALTDAEILAQAQLTLGTGYTTHIHDTNATLLSPAKHTSWKNAGTEKAFLDYAGQIYTPTILDSNANEELKFTTTTSAVNEFTITNAATGTNPILSATGGDTNIGITLTPKGTGSILHSGNASPTTNDGAALGSTTLMWSDLFLASGGVINFNNGDVTLTHSSNAITFAGGNLAMQGNITLRDNDQIVFGTGSDATISYDGTDLIIDPDVVGSGVVKINGGTTPVGRVNFPMGEISYFDTTGTAITISATSDGSTNMVVVNPTTALSSGVYEFDNGGANNGRLRYTGSVTKMFHVACTVSIASSGANDTFVLGVAKGGSVIAASKVLNKITTSGDTQSTALHIMVELATNEYLELYVGNITDADDLTIKSLNLFALGM